jgi:hypothetical protein
MCQGLEILAKRMGHQVEEVVFFGDGENDTAALRACGLGVAMANGTDSAKAAAHLTSRYRNTEDAVARELVRLVAEGEFGEGLQLDLKPLLLDGGGGQRRPEVTPPKQQQTQDGVTIATERVG